MPPKTEDRALMFDNEIRGQMAMLMGGRAAEELTCGQVCPLPSPRLCDIMGKITAISKSEFTSP